MELNKIVYICLLIVLMPITFKALMKIKIEKKFEANAIWQIKYIYIVLTIIISHFLAEFLLNLGDLFKIQ